MRGERPTSDQRTQVGPDTPNGATRSHADDVAELHRAATLSDDEPVQVLRTYLAIGCRVTGMRLGVAAALGGDALVVQATTGELTPATGLARGLDLSAEARATDVLDRRATVAHLAGVGRREASDLLGPGASVGSPVWVGGTVVGVVLFVDDTARPVPLTSWQMAVVDLVADGVARALEQAAGVQERRRSDSRTQALLDLIPDRIHRVDRSGRVLGDDGPGPPFDPAAARDGSARPATVPEAVQQRVRQIVEKTLVRGQVRTEVFPGDTDDDGRRYEARFVPSGEDEVLCIVRDVTERHRAERALAEQVAFEALAAAISTRLISCPPAETDDLVVAALGELGAFFDADVAYLDRRPRLGFGPRGRIHEWRRPEAPAPLSGTDVLDRSALGWAREQLRRSAHVLVRSLEDLPPEAAVEHRLMRAHHQRACLWVRLGDDPEIAPVLGLVWKREVPATADEVLGLVQFVGEALLGAVRQQDMALLAGGQAQVFELIARGAPLDETLAAVTALLQAGDDEVVAAALVLDEGGHGIVAAAAPSLDDSRRALLGEGSATIDSPVGMAIATGEAVRVHDLASDERFPAGPVLARRLRARSLVAVPVQAPRSGRTLAVLLVLGVAPGVAERIESARQESCEALAAVAVERADDDARLAFQATHDPLTGVANRAALLDRLSLALARSRRTGRSVAVLFCDLDRFKVVNDRFGHDRGDQLLVEVAERISVALRPSDTVSRLGGDEFVVLCEDLDDPTLAMVVAERVGRAIEAVAMVLGGEETRVTASIGVAVSSGDLDNPESLIRDADMAMYRAKANGRARRELFHAEAGEDPTPAELRRALDQGGLRLDLQPVAALDGTLIGVEALLRWSDPVRGEVVPDLIMPTAERGGLVTDLGRWVVAEALAQRTHLLTLDPRFASVPVHVNLSWRDLVVPGFVDQLQATLGAAGCPPPSLVVELSERSVTALEGDLVLQRLRDLGVGVMVDGFGAGGGPLAGLPALRLDAIKVDRSLAGVVDRDDGAWEVAAAVVRLAHGLGLQAIAVGVDTDAQLGAIRSLGFDAAQGEVMGRPGPANQVIATLRALLPGSEAASPG
ncbi:MAG: domain S-box/diguanylate cyclase protein [Acidimicrobiales bacterium]|nr:domain S-box/diguanylate cyclase protein [Acidimicrobiales bacterium]